MCLFVEMRLYMYSFMGRGVIDRPLKEVAEFIKNVENNMTWDYFLIVSLVTACKCYWYLK